MGRRDSKRLTRIRPGAAFILGLAALVAAGALALTLPVSTPDGQPIGALDAVFTATSAVCVTGLIVRDTAGAFTPFGQAIILLLIQLCGGIYLPWLGGLEHVVLERVLVVGWTIDEALGATPAWLLAIGLPVVAALAVALLGIAGPLEPAAGEAEASWPVLLLRAPVGLGLATAMAALVLFGVAVAPLTFLAVLAGSAVARASVR